MRVRDLPQLLAVVDSKGSDYSISPATYNNFIGENGVVGEVVSLFCLDGASCFDGVVV